MNPTEKTGSMAGDSFHRIVVVFGIALMAIVAAGRAVQEGLSKINLDALPHVTGGFLFWMAVSYTVIAAGFLWIGVVLARGLPLCMIEAGLLKRNTGAKHRGPTDR